MMSRKSHLFDLFLLCSTLLPVCLASPTHDGLVCEASLPGPSGDSDSIDDVLSVKSMGSRSSKDDVTDDRTAGIGIEFESSGLEFKPQGGVTCSARELDMAKQKVVWIDGEPASEALWALTVDNTNENSLTGEYIIDGREVKVGTGMAGDVARQIADHLRKGIVEPSHRIFHVNSRLEMFRLGIEQIFHETKKQILSKNPLVSSASSKKSSMVWVSPNFFQFGPGGIEQTEATSEIRGFLSLVLTYIKGDRGQTDKSPKGMSAVMPRTDFYHMYKLIEPRFNYQGSLYDLVKQLACWKNYADDDEVITDFDGDWCEFDGTTTVPTKKMDDLSIEVSYTMYQLNEQGESVGTRGTKALPIREWIESMTTQPFTYPARGSVDELTPTDKLSYIDTFVDGQIGGLGDATEYVLGTTVPAPIFEFRDLGAVQSPQFQQKVEALERAVIDLHEVAGGSRPAARALRPGPNNRDPNAVPVPVPAPALTRRGAQCAIATVVTVGGTAVATTLPGTLEYTGTAAATPSPPASSQSPSSPTPTPTPTKMPSHPCQAHNDVGAIPSQSLEARGSGENAGEEEEECEMYWNPTPTVTVTHLDTCMECVMSSPEETGGIGLGLGDQEDEEEDPCVPIPGCVIPTPMGAWLSNQSVPVGDVVGSDDGEALRQELFDLLREVCPYDDHCDSSVSTGKDMVVYTQNKGQPVRLVMEVISSSFNGSEQRDAMFASGVASWQAGAAGFCEEIVYYEPNGSGDCPPLDKRASRDQGRAPRVLGRRVNETIGGGGQDDDEDYQEGIGQGDEWPDRKCPVHMMQCSAPNHMTIWAGKEIEFASHMNIMFTVEIEEDPFSEFLCLAIVAGLTQVATPYIGRLIPPSVMGTINFEAMCDSDATAEDWFNME